jgi:hypothetical protein
MKLLSVFSALFISLSGWMYNSVQDKEATNHYTVTTADQVLKITMDQKNIKVSDGVFTGEGTVVNLSDKDSVEYHIWSEIVYLDKSTGETKKLSSTNTETLKSFGSKIPPLGEHPFKISLSGMGNSGSSPVLSGKGTISVFASPSFFPQIEKRISNLIQIKVNFDTNKCSILED